MKITAALSHGADTPFEIAEVDLDEPRADEVLVELRAVGICHTDLTMRAVWPAELSPAVVPDPSFRPHRPSRPGVLEAISSVRPWLICCALRA